MEKKKGIVEFISEFSREHVVIYSIVFVVSIYGILRLIAWPIKLMDMDSELKAIIPRAITAGIIILIYSRLKIDSKMGFRKEGLLKGIAIGWIMLVMSAVNLQQELSGADWSGYIKPSVFKIFLFTIHMLSTGLFEEVWIRGTVVNVMMKKWGDTKQGVYASVIGSGVVFGLLHLFNLIKYPQLIINTSVQVIYATMIGILFAAIYLRTKNLWSVIILHALFNYAGEITSLILKPVPPHEIVDLAIGDGAWMLLAMSPIMIAGLIIARKIKK